MLFESRGASQKRTITVTPSEICNQKRISVPLSGAGKSVPLICTTDQDTAITLEDNIGSKISDSRSKNTTLLPEAHTIYSEGDVPSRTLARSLILTELGVGANCNQTTGF